MPRPAVSVLMPVRDADPWLDSCLRSLTRQTFPDFEIIAVDDGSTDGSLSILEAWCQRDPRLRIVRLGSHRGLVGALEAGLAACHGDLIARMDADDVAARPRLELQARAFTADPRLDVCSCLVRHFPFGRVAEGFRRYDTWLNSLVSHDAIVRQRFVESPLAHPSVMIRRDLLVRVGGYRDRDWPEDYDLWLRLAAAGARFAKVTKVLHFWRDHAGRLTRRDPRYGKDRFLALKAHHLAAGPLAGRRAIIWGAGQTGKRLAHHLTMSGARIDHFLDVDPKKVGGRVQGRPVSSADELPALLAASDGAIVVAAVAARGARALIQARLNAWQLVEGDDYYLAA